jgi:indole-3-glycerol phosphate synthase
MEFSPRMTHAVPDILARIVTQKEVELRNVSVSRSALERDAEALMATRRDFAAALHSHDPAIIAEIKKASPSKGILSTDFDPARTAVQYEHGGAAALSVLTDESFFRGSLADLQQARSSVTIPVLRKDFTTSEYHVVEAAAHGADAILLIAAVLSQRQLRTFRELASQYGIASIVEVHDGDELHLAIESGAEIIGVNNRNLRTFQVSIDTSLSLAKHMPAGVLTISESGIQSQAQLQELRSAGYNAFLIGEHLMRASDPEQALRTLTSCS